MKLIPLLIGGILGLAAGAASAMVMAGMVGSGIRLSGDVNVENWQSDWTIGSATANPWTRARIARHGLLALTKEEAVYFTRASDDDGKPLTEACTYRVSGTAMPALWWSVTLYDGDSRLPPNTDKALSYDLTKAAAEGDADAWSFTVSPAHPAEGGWVSSRAADKFDLTLRLYKPSAALLSDPEATLPAPSVERLSCGGQGS
ncbi:DUF1214 domain-containing protein [Hyphomonas adhaerens]|uniref:DUF1214 domain-containing protein n=1 Tax=Hyphomonas adhaerens TaxID=81029 RepID=UPI0023579019|nr:DUF1214 domain-containing protein [Hyphomonas adhaerens]